MKQAVWSHHPNALVEYRFIHRNAADADLRPFRERIEEKIARMHGLGPTPEEIEFLRAQGYFKDSFLDSLAQFTLDTSHVTVGEKDERLTITVAGPWYQVIDFEVPLLRAINESYFEDQATDAVLDEGRRRLEAKIDRLLQIHEEGKAAQQAGARRHPFRLLEFGTRRAFSEEWHRYVVERLAARLPRELFPGSSNVHLSRLYGLVPQGTMAHEWIMAYQALAPLHLSQKAALDTWADEFRGKLGIALSDTLGQGQFLRDFDLLLALLFTGVRQDSGDPHRWTDRILAHYQSLGIDPYTKTAAYTDSLDIEKAYNLWVAYSDRIRCVFGIGTHFTNDLGPRALNIVMKMTHCNGLPLIKISDAPGKVMCEDPGFAKWAVHLFEEVLPAAA
jgi:nicotinate phosphoribosyltransferase